MPTMKKGFTPSPERALGKQERKAFDARLVRGFTPAPNGWVRGFTCGAFDLCHAGHILMFKEAKKCCDYLIVGLQNDPSITREKYRGKKKNKPIMSLKERRIILEGIRYIDKIITYRTEKELYKLIQKINPDVRIIGADWKNKKFTGWDLPIKIYYNSRNHNFSTTELRERIVRASK